MAKDNPSENIFDEVDPTNDQTQAAAEAETNANLVKELTDQVAQLSDRVLRAQAETDNVRKRARRELEDGLKYATLPLLRDLLSVSDNLLRAIEVAETQGNSEGLGAGVKLVAEQLAVALKQHSCVKIETVGVQFDPNLHEALSMEPSAEYPANVITRELRAGFKLHDRVIRPAQVFISSGAPAS